MVYVEIFNDASCVSGAAVGPEAAVIGLRISFCPPEIGSPLGETDK